ncbi:putative FAD-binding domain-containing protein [Rosellinia necatrix]|uniref:Putative FAD-binding domain-containing protein n=1 Tax=Rosellinia necatrix TaxID=77044 RepID=A0A1W2TJ55_ROSNE|nr:putative FAD-binding domain-containing protein [Rosellinia necatrix]
MRSFNYLAWLGLLGFPALTYAAPYLESREATLDIQSIVSSTKGSWSCGTVLSFGNTSEFQNATERWSTTDAPTYVAAITPSNEKDVAAAVKLANRFKIPFLATGGRHGYTTTLGKLQNGLSIDLSQLNSFSADVNASTVTVGAAANIGMFQDELFAKGLIVPHGSCACPGYVGLTVGAGVGRWQGTMGLVIDHLISARVVTAKGDLITVSEKENADLFWGLRGAGANLGIVTSATYRAERAVDHNNGYVLTADLRYQANATAAYFAYLEKTKFPANVGGVHLTFWNATEGQAELVANWVWIGPEREGREFMNQFLRFGPVAVDNYEYIPWNKLLDTAASGFGANGDCVRNQYRNTYSSNLKTVSGASMQRTFTRLQKWYADYPNGRGTATNLEVFPNDAVAAVRDDSTAYPWRDAQAFMVVTIMVDDETNSTLLDAGDKLSRELRADWDATGGYDAEGGSIYINYAHGDESLESRYGARKLPRLAALKKKWDPKNVFAYNNALPTRYA